MKRTYTELMQIPDYYERYKYLKCSKRVGDETFGFDRYINQIFYQSKEWQEAKREIRIRDDGNDMGFKGRPIGGNIVIHHMNPITIEDIINRNPDIFNPEFLISVSDMTHRAIHYGDESLLQHEPIERELNDTIPWK